MVKLDSDHRILSATVKISLRIQGANPVKRKHYNWNSVMPALKRTRLTVSAWRKTNWCINCVLMRVMERCERDNS